MAVNKRLDPALDRQVRETLNLLDNAGGIPMAIAAASALRNAIDAEKQQLPMTQDEVYRLVEDRLRSLPFKRIKLHNVKEELEDITQNGLQQRSKDIIRWGNQKSGGRLDATELEEVKIKDLEAQIIGLNIEITEVDQALDHYVGTINYRVIDLLYLGRTPVPISEIADALHRTEAQIDEIRHTTIVGITTLLYGTVTLYKKAAPAAHNGR